MSTNTGNNSYAIVDFNQMKDILSSNDPKYVIIDVRENDEYNAGHIQNSINLPYKSSPNALGLSAETFKSMFGIDKPSFNQTLVIYCRSGGRAVHSEKLAMKFGYKNRLVYAGSFLDWCANNGKVVTPSKF